MSTHDGTNLWEPLPQEPSQAVGFTVREATYQSGRIDISYYLDSSSDPLVRIGKNFDYADGDYVWRASAFRPCSAWREWTLVDMPTYRALLDAVEAKMQQLDSEFPPGSKFK